MRDHLDDMSRSRPVRRRRPRPQRRRRSAAPSPSRAAAHARAMARSRATRARIARLRRARALAARKRPPVRRTEVYAPTVILDGARGSDAKPISSRGTAAIGAPSAPGSPAMAQRWVRAQVANATRHLERLTPFKRAYFGEGLARPREANIQAANDLIAAERAKHAVKVRRLKDAARVALADPTPARLGPFAELKDRVAAGTRRTEGIWYFYDSVFAQRKGVYANELAAMDRIALDCYQTCYMGLGTARSLPTPPPLTWMEPARGPATYRRGVRVPKLARQANPFPLVRLPFHRMMNPWSLGAVPHEIGHNVHADLKLWTTTPRLIRDRLARDGMPVRVQKTWAKWHKEIYADLIGVLLIGPSYVESLLDVVGKSPGRVAAFRDGAVHPTSYLRPFISTELLRRIGFRTRADAYDGGWRRIYADSVARDVPQDVRRTFAAANRAVVEELCLRPMREYGGKRLVDVVRFRPQDLTTVREAADRLARGTNPGIAPARFFIAAARDALDRRLAPPETIARNFYTALTGS